MGMPGMGPPMPGMPGMGPPIPLPNPLGGDFGPGGGKRIVVLNLPWQASWQALKEFFSTVGNIARADIAIDDTGRSRGYGTVRYEPYTLHPTP
jgi:Y-box-binding protein 1